MSKNPFALKTQLSFEEVQQMHPVYEEYLNHFQKFRVNGIYVAGAGFAVIAGCIAAIFVPAISLPNVSFIDWVLKESPVFWLWLMGLGFLTAVIGGLVFTYGQVKISRAYRSFDDVMRPLVAAQIAEEQIKKENGHNGS